tara:strand:- start:10831 stop:13956 length:3126 start_codon:yes stop_codon:yes gene_type:complete
MIKGIIKWSIKNRFVVLAITFFLLVAGIYSLRQTPVDAIPDLSDVQVIIKTSYSGQAPQVVEDQITYPLTTAMLTVPGAVTVRGYSYFGDSYVYVIFEDGTDPYWARSRVLEYLSQISSKLPADAKPELGPDATGVGWVYTYALVDKSGAHDLSELTTLQNWLLKFELQTIPGVSEVATVGGMVKQYQVVLEPNRIRAYGLTIASVKNAIKRGNKEVGGSVIEMGEAEYMVRSSGYIDSVGSIKAIPLGVNKNGTPIVLSNVAEVNVGPQMRRGIAELNGEGEVVGGIIVMRQGENASDVISAVKNRLSELQSSLPEGVEIIETYDRSTLIKRAVDNLKITLIEECIVVVLICFVFLLHIRSSLIVVINLPIGILCAYIIMRWQGINANIMSLGGIAIAIGAMVDAGIVMIENLHKHFARTEITDKNRWQVIEASAMEVGPPIFFSLLIITLSFLPVFALQAQEGRMFAPLAFTKTYAMAAAAGLSITLVPVLMGYFIRGKILPEEKNPVNRALISMYKPIIHGVLRFPKAIILISFFIMISAYVPLKNIGSEFMPELDEGDWMYMPTTLPGISIGKARQVLQQTDKLIKTIPEVKTVFGKIGRAESATDPAPLTMIETIIQLHPKEQWRAGMTAQKLKEELNKTIQFPGITNAWVMPIKTRIDMLATGIKTPVGIKISGPSLDKIQEIGEQIEAALNNVNGTASVFADRAVGGRYVVIDTRRNDAARFGLNIDDVQEIVQTAIGGMNVTETIEGRERYPVNLRYPQYDRKSLQKVKSLPIVTPTGAHISLEDVATIAIEEGPPMIKSENARLTGWVLVDIENIDVGTYIKGAKKAILENVKMPTGYSLVWSGQYEYMERAKERLSSIAPLTLGIIIFLLYLSFRSIPEVLIILVSLPLALSGGIWLIYLLQYNLSVAAGVGFIALAGLAIEIGVIMLVYLNNSFKECLKENQNSGMNINDLKKVVISGAVLRVRPILMTVISTIIALLPIMIGGGTGSEVMRRIAAPMVGGLVSATILTLLVIPAIFFIWKSKKLGYVTP